MKNTILYSLYLVILLTLLYFDKVLEFVINVTGKLTAPIHNSGIVLFIIGMVVIITIEILRYKYPIVHKSDINKKSNYPLYSDQPTIEDKYDRTTSAEVLIEKIFSTFLSKQATNGSFVVNINESYGFGKTSFLKIFETLLRSKETDYIFIDYRPWLCENEQSIITEFFTLLLNELPDNNVKNDIADYLHLLLSQVQDTVPSWARPLTIILFRNFRGKSLREYHDSIKKSLIHIERPIIVTIDDVDRLQEKELTAVLKLIRDTADFPNIFYIVAADNTHLEMMLTKMGILNPDNYLKKFFNLDYLLPAHERVPIKILQTELEKILNSYGYSHEYIISSLMMLRRLPCMDKAFVNMREVYRFLNAYTSSLDILKKNGNLQLIDPYELFCLTIIRHLRLDIYKKLRDRNDEFLEVIHRRLDVCFHLKDNFNIEKIQRNKKILQHIEEVKGIKPSIDERKLQQAEAEKLTLDDAVKLTETTRNKIVVIILDHLFENIDNRDERSICRCNVYFLYFSGRIESTKLTTAESIHILRKDLPSYEKTLNELFKSMKANAFISNFSYAYQQAKIEKEDAMKKFYTLIKWQFNYSSDIEKRLFDTFEDYINKSYEQFVYFLYDLYGHNLNSNTKRIDKDTEEKLKAYCNTEPDINMLTLAFFIFSQRLGSFSFYRDFVNSMLNLLGDRLIKEQMTSFNPVGNSKESIFNTMILFKDEFSNRENWEAKLETFLCEDENRCKQWLSSMVSFYSDGQIDWNYRHHVAIMGEYSNSSDHLLETINKKFPNLTEEVKELKHFQGYNSLSGMSLNNSKYIQMARHIQQQIK